MTEALVPFAVAVLVAFFFVPDRYLGFGRWAIALAAFCFIFAVTSAHPSKDWEVWLSAIAAVACAVLWAARSAQINKVRDTHEKDTGEADGDGAT